MKKIEFLKTGTPSCKKCLVGTRKTDRSSCELLQDAMGIDCSKPFGYFRYVKQWVVANLDELKIGQEVLCPGVHIATVRAIDKINNYVYVQFQDTNVLMFRDRQLKIKK